MAGWLILLASFCYLSTLFAIAYYGDKRADEGRSIISNPYVYSLSLAVYCTAWTFYGNVGSAAKNGISYLPIYLGPTLIVCIWWVVLRKIIRISKTQRLTSIADFISSRYGKSNLLSGLVTFIAVAGIIPYISLQLKAISNSYLVLRQYPDIDLAAISHPVFLFNDTAFYATLILIVFALLFGTRHLDATERHEGVVAAIAFESVVKLLAFLILGIYVTYGLFNGFGDLFGRAETNYSELFVLSESQGAFSDWIALTLISMTAIMFLPRQFQISVVENVNENHLKKATWLFPLYLLIINLFVLPIAFGGLLHLPGQEANAEYFGLILPMEKGNWLITLIVFIGGMSAASSMVIVSTIALSTMISNDLIMPVLLRSPFWDLSEQKDLSGSILMIRRGSIVLVLLMGYVYVHFISKGETLVSIGMISFTAVAQFAPPILGGIFWKKGTRSGALTGLTAGFLIWVYTLVVPSLFEAGLMPLHIMTEGPFGISWLRPLQLFGLSGFSNIPHAVFWSLLFNMGLYYVVSLLSRPAALEYSQATLFVDIFRQSRDTYYFKTTATSIIDLRSLLVRFIGEQATDDALNKYAREHDINWDEALLAKTDLVNFAERLLAGAIGSGLARVMVDSIVKKEPLSNTEIMEMLDRTQKAIAHSRELEQKSADLEQATAELKEANEKLKELDHLKNDFVATVTHELRTPLTSIRALSEILFNNPDLEQEKQLEFTGIIIKEAERLSRLINQVLDIQTFDSQKAVLQLTLVNFTNAISDAVDATRQLIQDKNITLNMDIEEDIPLIAMDRDRIIQVIINLLFNAAKFCDKENGMISIRLTNESDCLRMDVKDNGIGIKARDQEIIFERFSRLKQKTWKTQSGSGLGLPICKLIIESHNGKIWVESKVKKGSTFSFTLPKHHKRDNEIERIDYVIM